MKSKQRIFILLLFIFSLLISLESKNFKISNNEKAIADVPLEDGGGSGGGSSSSSSSSSTPTPTPYVPDYGVAAFISCPGQVLGTS